MVGCCCCCCELLCKELEIVVCRGFANCTGVAGRGASGHLEGLGWVGDGVVGPWGMDPSVLHL
jgi:hypothetical protein